MVAQHIKDLLFVEDEIIINDLGMLKANYASAEIHPASHTFTPPSKNIAFDEKSKISNGVLERVIAKKEGITTDEAKEQVKQFVSTLKIDLGIHKKYDVPEVGTFLLQYEDQIDFKQDVSKNYLLDSFGLPELFGKPVERTKEENSQVKEQLKKETATKKVLIDKEKPLPVEDKKKVSWGAIAAVGSLAVVATWVGLVLFVSDSLNPFKYFTGSNNTPADTTAVQEDTELIADNNNSAENNNNTENTDYSNTDNNNVEDNTNNTDNTVQEANTNNTNTADNTNTTVTDNTNNTANNNNTYVYQPTTKKEDFSSLEVLMLNEKQNKFFIILGSFSGKQNALKFTQKLIDGGERKLRVIAPFDGQNRYRVAYESFATEQEAESRANELKSKFGADIWVLSY